MTLDSLLLDYRTRSEGVSMVQAQTSAPAAHAVAPVGSKRGLIVTSAAVVVLMVAAAAFFVGRSTHFLSTCPSQDWRSAFRSDVEALADDTGGTTIRSRQGSCANHSRVIVRMSNVPDGRAEVAALAHGWVAEPGYPVEQGAPNLFTKEFEGVTVRLSFGTPVGKDRVWISAFVPLADDD